MDEAQNVVDVHEKAATLILVAKYPSQGSSKTRLIPAFGVDLAAELAMSMLTDLLQRFSREDTRQEYRKVLLYAPPTATQDVSRLLEELGVGKAWEVHPVLSGTGLRSSNLSDILGAALADARQVQQEGAVIFVGMDAPELAWAEVEAAAAAARNNRAFVCPAMDGGYCLLGLPPSASPPVGVFDGVKWSDPLTCVSQMGALASLGVVTLVGGTYSDVDEAEDIVGFHARSTAGDSGLMSLCPNTALSAERAVVYMNMAVEPTTRAGGPACSVSPEERSR